MTNPHSSRRKDPNLRATINDIQASISSITKKSQLYERVLKKLCELTESPNGFVLELSADREKHDHLMCNHFFPPPNAETTPSTPTLFEIPITSITSEICRAMARNRPTVLSSDCRSQMQNTNTLLRDLSQVIVIPLPMGLNQHVALCIANAEKPYHSELAKRIWPLLSICASIHRILENKQPLTSQDKRLLMEKDTWRDNFSKLEFVSPIGMVTLNSEQTIVRANPAAESIFGFDSTSLREMTFNQIVPERFRNEHKTQTLNLHAGHQSHDETIVVQGKRSNGELIPLELSTYHFSEYGQPRTMVLLRDSSDLRSAQARNKTELQRFRVLADLSPMGILQTDENWRTSYVNQRWLQITGIQEDDIRGLNWSRILHQEDAEEILSALHESLSQGKEFRRDYRILHADRPLTWVQLHARPLYNSDGDISGFLSTLTDNSYYHESEQKLRELAEQDPLTGLANRILFNDRLIHALKRLDRHGSLALLALDLDGFKNINDTLGHDVGDEMLKQVSTRVQSCVRQEDTVARLGGDEFMILLEDMQDAMTAAAIAEGILRVLEKPFNLGAQEVYISTSIGICFALGGSKTNARTLLKQADMALYRAKDAGRNNFQYFSPELEKASKNKLELSNSLHMAISNSEFEVYFQPQAEVASGTIIGFEALLRWRHPKRGLLSPTEFIHLLEESGLVNSVSRWTFHVCLQNLRRWIDQKIVTPDTVMSVNISPLQFHDPVLVTSIEGAIRDAGLRGDNVVVEITETTLLQDHEQTRLALEQIKRLGVRVALDDFGTGYSSLSFLKKYPIDIIKIDRSFIKDMLIDKEDAAIVKAVIALAESLNMEVIAEGVDCHPILARLADWSCENYQGYYLNKPMSATETKRFLDNSSDGSSIPSCEAVS